MNKHLFLSLILVFIYPAASLSQISFERTYGSDYGDWGYSVQQTEDEGYIIAGYTGGNVYLIKTDPDGMVGITDNNPPSMKLPRSWALLQNYPNPFNPSTTISFEVPGNTATKQHVTLAVYDIRGRLVRTLVSSEITPGNHKLTWNGKDESGELVSSGIYLYTLRSGEERYTLKMVICTKL